MKSQEQVQKAVAEKIKAFKESENMVFQDMGEITGLGTVTIWTWAKCKKLPSLYGAYLLADAMGMTVNELMGGAK